MEINITYLYILLNMNNKQKNKNPFEGDKQGTATHLSTWNMRNNNQKFIWTKNPYRLVSEYNYELNVISIDIYYKNKHVKEINETMVAQQPTVENITRITQRKLTQYLESW